jgi:hypothetical protein
MSSDIQNMEIDFQKRYLEENDLRKRELYEALSQALNAVDTDAREQSVYRLPLDSNYRETVSDKTGITVRIHAEGVVLFKDKAANGRSILWDNGYRITVGGIGISSSRSEFDHVLAQTMCFLAQSVARAENEKVPF